MGFSKSTLFSFAILASFLLAVSIATHVSHDGKAITINGERKILISGAIHYPRSTPKMWPDLMAKAKEGGIDAIETYVFWNAHEPHRRQYQFDGQLDLVRFIKEIKNAGLYSILRLGPYVCAEWNYGGIPAWLRQIPGMQFRTDNKPYKDEMQIFVTKIVNMMKKEGLLASQGGPIIITQIENEYGNIEKPYGDAGKRYIEWCANLAESLNVNVPWVMCEQRDAPQPMINTCNGFYCNDFQPNNPNSPKLWTEHWTGWFKSWDAPDPHRPAEDVAYAVARFFQTGGTLQSYYMYHGGTNFGRSTGGPYITTSYDYDAPLDEYGNIRQPKWGHLKELHAAIKMMEAALLSGKIDNSIIGKGVNVTKFFGTNITSGCFLTNVNNDTDATVTYQGKTYHLPAWSVSILPDCKEEVFNTAKVGTQTSVMSKTSSQAHGQPSLSWKWRPEILTDHLFGKKPAFVLNRLMEQVVATLDVSDYLWYTTSVNNLKAGIMTLRVNTTGHGLYAYVNGVLVGSQYSSDGGSGFTFERSVTVRDGTNTIALVSVTVGLKNYGSFYEVTPTGIMGGPVQLSSGNTMIDLSNSPWNYKIGLNGEVRQRQLNDTKEDSKWLSGKLATNKSFTWYQATISSPAGSEPVAVDLQGMVKGMAFVNGHSLGRYWLRNATSAQCTLCDYRGAFTADRACRTGCGETAQRWYHVPRDYLKSGEENTLTLFEEAGGDPALVNFQKVYVGTVCGTVLEGKTLSLTCPGKISKVEFASFGNPQGTCQAFKKGSCEAPGTLAKVQQECVGKQSCSIKADESLLGACTNCGNVIKSLSVQAVCS